MSLVLEALGINPTNRMESGDVPNAEYEGDQAEKVRGAILHPLASITIEPQEWLNECNIRLQPVSSSFIEAGSFQSVCLDESVYFSERAVFSSYNNCVLHKCSMKTQSYYPLPTKVEGYALAVYQSKIVLIGGNVPSQNPGRAVGDPKYPISVLDDDSGLEERLKSALDRVPQESIARYVYKIGKNAYAVGEGDLLIVIGGDGTDNTLPLFSSNQEYVRVFDGRNWSYGIISITCTTHSSINIRSMQKTLLVFQNHIYLTIYDGCYSQISFYCISLECFRSQLNPRAQLSWNPLEDVPNHALCTNLSVLGNQLITVGVVDGRFTMYAYMAKSSEWITVHEFQPSDVNSVPSITGIIGLQSSTDQAEALLVGADHQLARICKLTIKSQPYNSDSEVDFLALLKLEELANIPVLTHIEENVEIFVKTAGFKLVHSRRRREVRIAYECIKSWKREKIRYYEPTWTGLFAVLKQIGLNSLATSIDSFLRETSPSESIEQLAERKDPEKAMDMLVKLKESLTELSEAELSDLQIGVIACASKCDKILQKFKNEKIDTERELESRIEELTSELTLLRESIHDQPPGAKHRRIDASDRKDDSPIPKLKDLLKELHKVAAKWHNLGIMLEIDNGKLSKVKLDNAGNSNDSLREMLNIWLKKVDPKPSWSSMAEALDDDIVGEESLAEHIRKTYCSTR